MAKDEALSRLRPGFKSRWRHLTILAFEGKEECPYYVLVSSINKNNIRVRDPRFMMKNSWEGELSEFISAMSKESNGKERGLFIFS